MSPICSKADLNFIENWMELLQCKGLKHTQYGHLTDQKEKAYDLVSLRKQVESQGGEGDVIKGRQSSPFLDGVAVELGPSPSRAKATFYCVRNAGMKMTNQRHCNRI